MHAMREITGQCVREAPTPGSLKASKGYGIGHDQEEAASFSLACRCPCRQS